MPTFKLPLAGDVMQSILPWTWAPPFSGGQWGLINVTLGQSSAPEVEAEVLSDVAGYGKQLGRVCDVVQVLMRHLPKDVPLDADEREALDAFSDMVGEIDRIKRRHARVARRR